MGRGADSKRLRRITEQVERALVRGDLPAAVTTLVELPAEARADLIARVAPAFRAWVTGPAGARVWGVLHTLAARAEAEPRLLELGAAGEQSDAARFVLLLACLRAKDWARAGRFLTKLRPLLEARAPRLTQALQAWIQGAGNLDATQLAEAGWRDDGSSSAAPAKDPRLGYERPAGRRTQQVPPAPLTAAAVEGAVMGLAATQPFVAFAETVLTWRQQAPAELARSISVVAAGLATRELLRIARAGGRFAEPLLLLARLAERAEVTAEIQLALRLSLHAAGAGTCDQRTASAIGPLVAAAARSPEAQALLVGWVVAQPAGRVRPIALTVAEVLLDTKVPLSAGQRREVWAAALALWVPDDEREATLRAPPWLSRATTVVLEQAPDLGRWVAALEERRRERLCGAAVDSLTPELATRLLEALWGPSDERGRAALSECVLDLIDGVQEEAIDNLTSGAISGGAALNRVLEALDRGEDPPLVPQSLAILRRIGPLALRHQPVLLGFLLADASGEKEARLLIDAYLEGRRDVIERRLEAVKAIVDSGRHQLLAANLFTSLEEFANDPRSMARALLWADRHGAPLSMCRQFGESFLASMAAALPAAADDPSIAAALEIADELFPEKRRRPPRKPRKKRKPAPRAPEQTADPVVTTPPTARRRRPARQPAQQLTLPMPLEEDPR